MKITEVLKNMESENPQEKISVIVAVYNIEQYLDRCVNSVLNQTYHNLEVILVDDGSTDNSGVLCDEFAKQDSRVIVLHKENGGLSDARNAGAKAATGEYITYVDGDDWIEEGMYKAMLGAVKKCQAEIAVCRYKCVYPDRVVDGSTDEVIVFDGREALRAYIKEDERYQMQNAAWNKLYRREFVEGLQFPKGKLYEDIVYTAKLFGRAKRTVYLDRAYYNYVLGREGSIMAAGVNERILTDQLPAYFERSRFLREIGELELADCHDFFVYKRMLLTYTAFARGKCHSKEEHRIRRQNLKRLEKMIREQKENFTAAYHSASANSNEEKKMKIFLCSPILYRIVMSMNDKYVIPYKERKILKQRVAHLHVVQMTGGLGNQMFQYAFYRKLLSLGKTVKIEDESGYQAEGTREKHLKKAFGISYECPTVEEMRLLTDSSMKLVSRIRRKLFGRQKKAYVEQQFNFNPEAFLQECAYYEGCWQSEKYFSDIEEDLREAFTFRCEISKESRQVLNRIVASNAVSLHIRRGDYLGVEQQKVYGGICTQQYYDRAVAYVREKVENARFFVFTNDPVWAREHIEGKEFEIVDCNEENTGYLDMLLMSRCKHHIIANSSFSWWGAWLNPRQDKIVIAPAKWLNGRDCRDIYTEGMLAISGDI